MSKSILATAFILFVFQVSAQTAPEQKPKPILDDYVGRYVFPEGSVVPDVTVVVSENSLSMTSAAGASSLAESGIDSFVIVEFNGIAAFKRGEDKKVNAVHIEAQGYVLDGLKQSSGSWSFYIKPVNSELNTRRK